MKDEQEHQLAQTDVAQEAGDGDSERKERRKQAVDEIISQALTPALSNNETFRSDAEGQALRGLRFIINPDYLPDDQGTFVEKMKDKGGKVVMPRALPLEDGRSLMEITGVENGKFKCTIKLPDGSTKVAEIGRYDIFRATLAVNADALSKGNRYVAPVRDLIRVYGEYMQGANDFSDEGIDALVEKAKAGPFENQSGEEDKKIADEKDSTPEKELLDQANKLLAQQRTVILKHIENLNEDMEIREEDGDSTLAHENRLKRLEQLQQQIETAASVDGQVGIILKQKALAALSDGEATAMAGKLEPLRANAERNIPNILADHGMDDAARTEMQTLLEKGDIEGFIQKVGTLKTADVAMEKLFGSNLNSQEKIEEFMKKAGYSKDEMEKMKKILAAGGLTAFGLVALLLMGPLAASITVVKSSMSSSR